MIRLLLAFLLLAAPLQAETRVPASQPEISLSFAPLVREAAPAVVNIYARRIVETRRSPFADDPFFRNFFGNLGQTRPRVQNSLGSGVILSADGIVVSNYHVVGEATDIRVVLNDRREYSARVLLGDEESDLAILKLDGAKDMPHLSLRDSDTVEVGELALAIGNPFGVGQTVSSGIISGLARSGTATGNARGYFIQTDAPINPGNSGGALIDVKGRLIGVNTSILTRSGGSNGIGFAIPASLVAQFVEQARDGLSAFQRPWAGMTGQPVDADLAASLDLGAPGGVIVAALHPESPFAVAGVDAGDVVTAIDGVEVFSPPEMLYRMSVRGIGESAAVTFVRDGDVATAKVSLILPPEVPSRDAYTLTEREILDGVVLSMVNPAVIAEMGLPLSASGVVVTNPGRLGRRIGLRRGDVIQQIERSLTTDPSSGDFVEQRDLIDITHPRDVARAFREASALPQINARFDLQVLREGSRVSLRFRL